MKTWKLVSGIISIILCIFVVFQSFAAGVYNTLTKNGQLSGSAGVIVAIMLLSGGIVSIATRKGGKGGDIALMILFGLGALIGYAGAGSYRDLIVWASWCLICAALAAASLVKALKGVAPAPEQPAPVAAAPAEYGPAHQAPGKDWVDKIQPVLPLVYVVWFAGIAAGTFFVLWLFF